jgi:hypothetical protein
MNRKLILVLGLMSIAVTASASPKMKTHPKLNAAHVTKKPDGQLSAADIVKRNVAARGGLEAWRGVKTLVMKGRMEGGGKANTDLPYVMEMKRPHMSRLEIHFKDQDAVQVYDGTQGWKLRPFLGRTEAEPFTADEAKQAASWAELDGPLVDYAHKGTKVSLDGKEAVEGHDAYKLRLQLKNGVERMVWIDAASFLELKISGEPRKMDGKPHNVAIYYRDYRSDNGLILPHVLETRVEGVKTSHKMTVQQVAVNEPLEDNLFAKPRVVVTIASAH